MATEKHFNTSILRKLREGIISTLRQAGLEHINHYKITAVNELSTTFTLNLIFKSASSQSSKIKMSTIKSALLERYPEIIFNLPSNESIRLDLVKEYQGLSEQQGKSPPPSSVNDEDIGTTGTYRTFLKDIQEIIVNKFFKAKEFSGKITKYKGDKNVASITIPKQILYQVTDYLVGHEGLKVVPSIDQSITVYRDTKPSGNEADRYVSFMSDYNLAKSLIAQLTELIRQSILHLRSGHGGEPIFGCNTPASELVYHNCEGTVHFTIPDTVLANGVAMTFAELAIPAEKIGQALYLTVTKKISVKDMEKRWDNFTQRAKIKKQGFMVEKNADGSGRMVTHVSHDYSQFHYLPFNRPRDKGHVAELRKSIQEFGFLDFVIVARTDVVDGVMKDWIVDRQHRFDALVMDKMPIPYAIIHVHSQYELIRLVATLNSSSRPWTAKDYLHAWSTMKMEEYTIIDKWKERVPITTVLQTMTGLDKRTLTEKFRQGTLRFTNVERGQKILGELVELREYLPKGVRYLSASAKFLFKKHVEGKFNFRRLIDNINVQKLEFDPNDRDQQIIHKLELKLAA